MHSINVTLGSAGILGLVYLILSIRVVMARVNSKTVIGDGVGKPGTQELLVAIRAHANFAEYVPLILLLLGGVEWRGANHDLVLVLAATLILGRIAHPIGMALPAPNPARAGGAMLTWVVLGVVSFMALALAL